MFFLQPTFLGSGDTHKVYVSSGHHCSDFLPLLNSYSMSDLYIFFFPLEIWEVAGKNKSNKSSTP